jgi:hypothetical protein
VSVRTWESAVRVTHAPTGRVVTVQGGWRESVHKMREKAISLLRARIWCETNEPPDMSREVAVYDIPLGEEQHGPHDLAPYRIGPAIGTAQQARKGEGE